MIIKNIFRINPLKGVLLHTNDHKQNLLIARSKPTLKDSTKRQHHLTANTIKKLRKHFMIELQRETIKKHNIQAINTLTNKDQNNLLNKNFLNMCPNTRSSDRS